MPRGETDVKELPFLPDVTTIAPSFDDMVCATTASGDLWCSERGGPWRAPVIDIHDAVEVLAMSQLSTKIVIRRKNGAVLVWTPNESSERKGADGAMVHPLFDSDGPLLSSGWVVCSIRSAHMAVVERPSHPSDPNVPRWLNEAPSIKAGRGGMVCADDGGERPSEKLTHMLDPR